MGCDIHAWVETRKSDGSWTMVKERIFPTPYWKEGDEVRDETFEDGSTYYRGPMTEDPYSFRNYNLFAILADVRNGRGFAGIPTGTGFDPIASPRGIPEDASPEYLHEVNEWDGDGHSHSWFTLTELQAYPWDAKKSTLYGVFSEGEYIQSLRTGKRESYFGDVTGERVIVLTPDGYVEMLGHPWSSKRDPVKEYYIRDSWEETYREAVGEYFFDHTLRVMATLGSPGDVRLVFFFDN
jgi:hypothetical protein